jgi:hypothetical protein
MMGNQCTKIDGMRWKSSGLGLPSFACGSRIVSDTFSIGHIRHVDLATKILLQTYDMYPDLDRTKDTPEGPQNST